MTFESLLGAYSALTNPTTETPIRYLVPGEGKTRTGYFWTCHRPDGTCATRLL